MDKKAKNTIIVSVIALALVLIGVTYAYFSARITGLESASTISMTAGRMGIEYAEGDENVTASNIYPKEEAWITKTFTLTGYNTTDLEMKYTVGLNVETNTFPNNYLTYDLKVLESDSGTPVSEKTNTPINGTGFIKFGTGSFNGANGDKHKYELKIYFKDNGLDQNDAQGKVFNAKINVVEAKEEPEGWSNAQAGTLLAGIKGNYSTPTATLTTLGQAVSTTNEKVMAKTRDDYGTSYYFRGAVDNNYVVFANMCWRIVRIDGQGNTKLTLYNYNPTGASNPCDASLDGETMAFARVNDSYTSKFNTNYNHNDLFNTNYSHNAFIGYMYGDVNGNTYEEVHANTNKSTILTFLMTWYDEKLRSYNDLLADTIWCNDKRVVKDTTYDPFEDGNVLGTGLGTDPTYYQATKRIKPSSSAVPSLKCGERTEDNKISKFTASDKINGNGALTFEGKEYKIGLLTADEIAFAGATSSSGNSSYYLYKNANDGSNMYWSLSPVAMRGSYASVWFVFVGGSLTNGAVINSSGVRPAVSLKRAASITSGGNGTQSNPFVVS